MTVVSANRVLDVGNGYPLTATGADVLNGGTILVFSGGTAVDTVLSGYMIVGSGGVDYSTVVEPGGSQVVVATGVDSNTTIHSGGSQIDGGFAGGAVIQGGGQQHVNGGALASGTQVSAGGLQFDVGSAVGTVISAGGSEYVAAGATTSLTTIDGGTLELDLSASLGGTPLTFAPVATPAHGGTLLIDATAMPGETIRGFAPGDSIDLVAVGYVSGGSVSLLAGNVLQVVATGTVTGGTYDFHLDPAQSFAGETFSVGWDGNTAANFDGTSGGTVITVACFRTGTSIATDRGDMPVESLRPGNRVALAGGGTDTVRWVGHRRVDCRRHPRPDDVRPVRIAAHAFGLGRPARDVWLSPDHAVFMDGVLIPVRYLLNAATVRQEDAAAVTYWHVELSAHGVLLAEGLPAESYLDTGNRAAFANGGGVALAHPDFARATWAGRGCAPLVTEGPMRDAVYRRLLAQAVALGWRAMDLGDRAVAWAAPVTSPPARCVALASCAPRSA